MQHIKGWEETFLDISWDILWLEWSGPCLEIKVDTGQSTESIEIERQVRDQNHCTRERQVSREEREERVKLFQLWILWKYIHLPCQKYFRIEIKLNDWILNSRRNWKKHTKQKLNSNFSCYPKVVLCYCLL